MRLVITSQGDLCMKRYTYRLSLLALLGASTAMAQPPGPPDRPGPPGQGGPGGGPRDGFRMPPHPVMEALDLNHDQILSEDEVRAAAKSLMTLDKNGDGKLTQDEIQPQFGPGGFRGPGPRDGDRPEGRRPDGDRPEGRRPDGERPEGRRPDGERPEGSEEARRPRSPEGSEGPPRDREGPGGPGGFQGPNPERFVAMALEFDTDKDGKLNRDELMKFAKEIPQRRAGGPEGGPGPRGPGGPEGARRPETGRPEGGRPEGGGRPEESGRPDRPRRPE